MRWLLLFGILSGPDDLGIAGHKSSVWGGDLDRSGSNDEPLRTIFYAPLDANPLSLDWGNQDLPAAPDVEWFGSDPTIGGALTLTGTPDATDADSPFCPVNQYDDIGSSVCGGGVLFDNADSAYYYDATNTLGPTTGDLTVCALADRTAINSNEILVARRNSSLVGWNLFLNSTNCSGAVRGASGFVTPTATTATAGWQLCCMTFDDSDDNAYAFANGKKGSVANATVGDYDPTAGSDEELRFGFWRGTLGMDGVLAWSGVWSSVLADAEISAIAAHVQGVYSPTAGAPTINGSTTGPICCTVGGKLECYADDWLPVGCEVPPGLTGEGGGDGVTSVETQTNNLLYSRDLSTGWTETGTSVVACSQASTPFRNTQRTTCKITDDDGAGAEYISQTVDVTALDAADTVQVLLYAAADSAQNVDIQVVEQTGASCSTTTTDFSTGVLSTTWTAFEFEHTMLDGDCTDLVLRIAPVDDITDTSATGHAYVVAQMGLDQNFQAPSPIYCETTSSTVSCGDMLNKYPAFAPDFDLGPILVSFEYTPLYAPSGTPSTNYAYYIDGTSDHSFYFGTNGNVPTLVTGGTTHTFSADTGLAVGTGTSVFVTSNTVNEYHSYRGGITDSSTTASGTTGTITDITIGANTSGAAQGAAVIKNFRIQQ